MIPRAETLKLFVRNQAAKLGAAIAEARKQQGLSQAYLAKQLHVTIPTLRKLESGDASVSMATFLAALLLLKIEGEVLNTRLSRHETLPRLAKEKEAGFIKQLRRQGISADDAELAARVLSLSPQQRVKLLIQQENECLETVAALVQSIEQHHGRAMLIGETVMFLYGKAQRSPDCQLWVRIANDELVEIVTALGFEIESNRAGHMVAFDEGRRVEFMLSKRAYNHDHEQLEYDAVEAGGLAVSFEQGKLMIPCIEDMIKLKKLDEVKQGKHLEDIVYLESILKVDF